MAHAPRSTTLPYPGTQVSTRDLYATPTPSFRRPPDHAPRSPSFPGSIRRHPLSPTPSPGLGFTAPLRMDPGYPSKNQQSVPPLMPMTTLGVLQYADPSYQGTLVKIDINGTIDKGFFLADNEWTCYRRNYFSCVCSYTLTPHYPTAPMQFTPTGSPQAYPVIAFAMTISAVVADNDGQAIELVQHTPKRDKGPIARPDKVRLAPKPAQAPHHPLGSGIYGQADPGLGSSRPFEQPFSQSPGSSFPTEHTFERIQFKQATANNGKRRAAQQYYHLLIELWADTGSQANDPYVRIAYRKSAKMIVRGRSPGHYQSERRGSASSGPGGSAGSMGHYSGSSVMGSDFGPGNSMLPGPFGTGYETRSSNHYGTANRHHQELPIEPVLSPEEDKAITDTKAYQYYPTSIYESEQEARNTVEMFSHQRGEREAMVPPLASGLDVASKVKAEYDGTLPSLFYSSQLYASGCGRFEGKPDSRGYYPSPAVPPSSTLNMT